MIIRKPVSYWRLFLRLRLHWLIYPVGFAIWMIVSVAPDMSKQLLLAADGITIDAVVTDRERRRRADSDGREQITYFLTYRYVPDGQVMPIEQRQSVSRTRFETANIGQRIAVRYSWTQPKQASVDLRHDWRGVLLYAGPATLIILIAAGVAGWMLDRKMSIIRALRHGEIREARVTVLEETTIRINNIPQFRLLWRDAMGEAGASMVATKSKLSNYPVDSMISVYIDPKTGKGWWEKQIL